MEERVLIAGLFLGVFSLILWLVAPIGGAVAMAGLVIGIYSALERVNGMALATVLLSATGLLLVMLNLLIWQMGVSVQFSVS